MKRLTIFLVTVSFLIFTGCRCKYPEIFIYVRKLTFPDIVKDDRINIVVGEMQNLAVNVHPYNSTIQNIEYTSGDEKVFTVGPTGVITGIGTGTAVLTATATDEKAVEVKCTVNVHPNAIQVQEILFSDAENNTISHPVGFILLRSEIRVEVLPEVATDKTYTLTTGDENIAYFDDNGDLVFGNIGETTLTATANDGSNVASTITLVVTGQ